MAQTRQVPATQFSRSFAKYQDEALAIDVIEVTSHGRVVGGYLSAKELDHYNELKRREREVLFASELSPEDLEDIKNAQYGIVSE